jgi:hypothetical protein
MALTLCVIAGLPSSHPQTITRFTTQGGIWESPSTIRALSNGEETKLTQLVPAQNIAQGESPRLCSLCGMQHIHRRGLVRVANTWLLEGGIEQ